MKLELAGLILATIDTLCWAVCFWWMHRISARQDRMLTELREQAERIEHFSKVEHDLIREVHPVVGEIKESVETVAEAVSERK